jgi:superfamily II DNA or RNA helicase
VLADDGDRNSIITDLVVRLVDSGRRVLVFCCSVAHAQHLALQCALGDCTAAFVDYRQRQVRREAVIAGFHRGNISALFNFGILSTGFDVPSVDAVVIARPTKSKVLYSQMIGRGLRGPSVGGTAKCTVYDVDENLSRFAGLDEMYDSFAANWG